MHATCATLTQIVGAIGAPDFPSRAAEELCGFAGFDLAAVILHHDRRRASVLFDNFDRVEGRRGIETYVRATRRINPMVSHDRRPGAIRARDFAGGSGTSRLCDDIVDAPDEELGYRTRGWPALQEEIGLYFPAPGGLMEIGLYRKRAARAASPGLLAALDAMAGPVAAAFERHGKLRSETEAAGDTAPSCPVLTRREKEVCRLLFLGCSTASIALRLSISPFTVKDHRKNIFRKLAISSLAELFSLAHRFPLWRDGIAAAGVPDSPVSNLGSVTCVM